MSSIMEKVDPKDIIAIVTIISGTILKFFGFDGTVGSILVTVVAFYFGEKKLRRGGDQTEAEPADKKKPKKIIIEVAEQFGVDPELAVRVARCESGLDPQAVNENPRGSRDRGLYQINDYFHSDVTDEQAFDPRFSAEFFCAAVDSGHLSWWDASRDCWGDVA